MSTSRFSEPWWADRLSRIEAAVQSGPRASVNRIVQASPDPFRVLVSTVISLRTRDEITFEASDRLFSVAANPSAVAALPEERIADLIYPAAFFRNKAHTIHDIATAIRDRYRGKTPKTREELLSFKGVGRKTANLVLGLGFGVPAICVDVHVHRIPNRLGWISTTDPDQTEQALSEILPERYWISVNETLVRFGQQVCTPQSPRCSSCPLSAECPRAGVMRSR